MIGFAAFKRMACGLLHDGAIIGVDAEQPLFHRLRVFFDLGNLSVEWREVDLLRSYVIVINANSTRFGGKAQSLLRDAQSFFRLFATGNVLKDIDSANWFSCFIEKGINVDQS